jgi:hypothetical protein
MSGHPFESPANPVWRNIAAPVPLLCSKRSTLASARAPAMRGVHIWLIQELARRRQAPCLLISLVMLAPSIVRQPLMHVVHMNVMHDALAVNRIFVHRVHCGRKVARLKSRQATQLSDDASFWEDAAGGEVSSLMVSETFRPTARAKTLMLSSVTFWPFSTRLTKLWPRLARFATCSCVHPRAARFRSRAAPNCWQRRLDIWSACSCTDRVRFLGALAGTSGPDSMDYQ